MNILLTNSGRRTYMVKYLFELKDSYNNSIEIFLSDTSEDVSSFWVDQRSNNILTPRVDRDQNQYIKILLEECKKNKIDMLIPLMDYELHLLSKNVSKFNDIGTSVVISDFNTVSNCLNKDKCYSFCNEHNIAVPKTWNSKNQIKSSKSIVVKKINGSGSIDMHTFNSKKAIPSHFDNTFLYQEYITGQEYGMDVFNDFNGNFIHCCVKKKISMRSGETDKAEVIYDRRFNELAQKISAVFKHVGNLDVDFIIDNFNDIYFIDFNPRFGGGYPYTHMAGFDYLKALHKLTLGEKVSIDLKGKEITGMKGIEIYTLG